jgi:hypothetical protein
LFDIKPEQRAKAKVGLSVLPLPAQKWIWNSSEEKGWKDSYDEILKSREGRTCLTYGDLLAVGKVGVDEGGARMKDPNAWMVSGDAFGIFVMMAATIF